MDTAELLKMNGVSAEVAAKFAQINQNQKQETFADPETGKIYYGKEAIKLKAAQAQKNALPPELPVKHNISDTEYWLKKFVTVELNELKATVRRLSTVKDSVIITAATGSGKELIARALHGNRPGNFVAVNCGGLPEHLFESEFFGHVKGSFTGAINDKVGLLQQAHNGTVFFDEISLLPKFMQGKLLRSIQERTIRKVGSLQEESINCRIVAATNREMNGLIESDIFMEDLYWRLSVIELYIPKLIVRPKDWWPIAKSLGLEDTAVNKETVINYCQNSDLLGGVRELQRYVRRLQLGI